MTRKQEQKIISIIMVVLTALTLFSVGIAVAAVQEVSRLQYDLIDAKAGAQEKTDMYNALTEQIQGYDLQNEDFYGGDRNGL